MGYAIPITTAKPVIEELMQHETKRKVSDNERSFLGISGTDVTSDVSATYDMPKGVYVAQVLENSAAESAGILKGDIIVAFEGETITTMSQLQGVLEYYAAGSTVDVTVMRQSTGSYQEKTLSVTLGAKNQQKGMVTYMSDQDKKDDLDILDISEEDETSKEPSDETSEEKTKDEKTTEEALR